MNPIGGEGVVIGDSKVWTNSAVVKEAIRTEMRRSTIREGIAKGEHQSECKRMFEKNHGEEGSINEKMKWKGICPRKNIG